MQGNQLLFSRSQARSILGGVSEATMDRWSQEGRLRSVKLGRRVMYEHAELERFIAQAKGRDRIQQQ